MGPVDQSPSIDRGLIEHLQASYRKFMWTELARFAERQPAVLLHERTALNYTAIVHQIFVQAASANPTVASTGNEYLGHLQDWFFDFRAEVCAEYRSIQQGG
jgi:hypothetical protein